MGTSGVMVPPCPAIIPFTSSAQLPFEEEGGADKAFEMDGMMKAVMSASQVVAVPEQTQGPTSSRKVHFKGLRIKVMKWYVEMLMCCGISCCCLLC
jgi:hypothetical protein